MPVVISFIIIIYILNRLRNYYGNRLMGEGGREVIIFL